MKKTLKVYTRKDAYQDYVDQFEIIDGDELPKVGDSWGNHETVVSIKPYMDGRFETPQGVWNYDLYTITTQDKPVFEDDEPSFNEYDVAVETFQPMESFIENLWDNLEEEPHEIDIEEARLDVQNFYWQDGWYLPEDLTPETYMKAWNEYVRKHGDLDADD